MEFPTDSDMYIGEEDIFDYVDRVEREEMEATSAIYVGLMQDGFTSR
jgi:hypothetical protein